MAQFVQLDVVASTASTNSDLLLDLRPEGLQCLIAEAQTAGRGRRGRHWQSMPGTHLAFSLARHFASRDVAGLPIALGVSIAAALRALSCDVGLKWPNDLVRILPDGRLAKLGGLLVESAITANGSVRAVMGIGLNVYAAPQVEGQPTAALDIDLPRERILAALLQGIVQDLNVFARDGLKPFVPRFADFDVLKDQSVHVLQDAYAHNAKPQLAVAQGIGASGALRVMFADGGISELHSGEVSIRKVAA